MNNADLRIQTGVDRGQPFFISVDGQSVSAFSGETLATVLIAAGFRRFRRTLLSGAPRGPYCGMGLCFDCLLTVNGRPNVRACLTLVQPGDDIRREP